MKRRIFIIASVALLGIIFHPTFFYRLLYPPSKQEVIQRIFENPQLFGVITSAPEVTVQRLHRKNDEQGYPLSSYDQDAPVPLSADEAQKIKVLLGSPSSYLWDIGNTCIPDYGALFNFRSGKQTVRVAFCFRCNMVGVFDGEDDNARQVNFVYLFNPMRQPVAEMCKAIFPNDKEIRSLK